MDQKKVMEMKLFSFAAEGKLSEVRSLLNDGVDVNVKLFDRFTPLILAAQHSNLKVVELLINSGADLNCCYARNLTLLHCASRNGWVRIVQLLINKNFDLDVKTDRDETALLFAARNGHEDIVKLLLESGANVNICNHEKYSPLHCAAFEGNLEMVKAIVKKGADVNAKNFVGHTPLYMNVGFRSNIECVSFLIKAGADCNASDYLGVSPLSQLIKQKSVGAIRLSIEYGAYVTVFDYNKLVASPLLKCSVLERRKVCLQAIVNAYNKRDLPALYQVVSPGMLPNIDKIMIKNNSVMAKEIDKAVAQEIKKKTFCNLLTVRPIVLSMLCVNSYLAYACATAASRVPSDQIHPSGSQYRLKRLGTQDCLANPAKKMFF